MDGFLLSRHWFDVKKRSGRGNEPGLHLEYWLTSSRGPIRLVFDNQSAVFFIADSELENAVAHLTSLFTMESTRWHSRALALKSFSHESVHAIYFARQRDLYQAREFLKQQGLTPLEA
ncbi:MAG: DNA polymerase-2, partial [Lentisphaeria bacterium]